MVVNEAAVYLPDKECHLTIIKRNPDMMHWHMAMRQPDHHEFMKAAEDEVQAHTENGLWEVVP